MNDVEVKMKSAVVGLLIKHPFFGSIVMKRPIELDEVVGTAAVNLGGAIRIAPSFVEKLTKEQLMFTLAHEAMHVVYAHLPRLQGRDPLMWNVATDAVINDLLERECVGTPIDGCVRMPGSADKSADEVYETLKQDQEKQQQSGGQGGQRQQGQGQQYQVPMNDLRPEYIKDGVSESEARRKETQGKMEIAEAAQGCRMQGNLSKGLSSLVEKLLESKVPWHQVLERFMVGKAEQRHSWNRPNKRFLQTAYLPRRERLPSMGKVVIGIDVSGSISTEEVERFLGHVNGIIEQCHPEEVAVLYATTEIEHEDIFTRDMYPVTPTKKRWFGGTDMGCVTQWIEDRGEDVDVCVIFTDGYTPPPKVLPCDIVWVVTTDTPLRGFSGEVLRDYGD